MFNAATFQYLSCLVLNIMRYRSLGINISNIINSNIIIIYCCIDILLILILTILLLILLTIFKLNKNL